MHFSYVAIGLFGAISGSTLTAGRSGCSASVTAWDQIDLRLDAIFHPADPPPRRHDLSFCCSPAGIINIQTRNLSPLTSPKISAPVLRLIVLFVHDFWHNNGFPHTCGTNDRTVAELGAWGVQYHLNVLLANHSDPTFIRDRTSFGRDAVSVCSTRFCDDKISLRRVASSCARLLVHSARPRGAKPSLAAAILNDHE